MVKWGRWGKKRYSIHPHMYILRVDDPHNLFPQPSPPPRSNALKSYQLQYTILESVNQNHLFGDTKDRETWKIHDSNFGWKITVFDTVQKHLIYSSYRKLSFKPPSPLTTYTKRTRFVEPRENAKKVNTPLFNPLAHRSPRCRYHHQKKPEMQQDSSRPFLASRHITLSDMCIYMLCPFLHPSMIIPCASLPRTPIVLLPVARLPGRGVAVVGP